MSATPSAVPSVINCHIENPTFTVGEVRVMTCDVPGVTLGPQSKIEFSFSAIDPKEDHQIQFLDSPRAQGSVISQDITGYKVGTHSLNQIKLKIDEHEYLVSPQNFETRTILSQSVGQNPTPYPLLGPEGVPVPLWWWITVGIISAVLLGVAVWQAIKFKKRREAKKVEESKPKLTPQEIFQGKIRKLESKGLHTRGEYKLFALELTTIIKKTIGEELHFQAEDLTSEELLSTLERRHRAYSNAAGTTLETFLLDLDQIKFAKIETDAQKCMDLLDRGARIGNALFGRGG